ncbi:WD40 domain-containing protein [Streptomyces violaceus]|uniref:WD40 domain-containing protein n=1 Tax=Streptomyces violaceus TaxID=1936 RepID=A0ABZ1NL14_STRVL
MALRPDGRTIAAGSTDGTTRLWHVAASPESGEAIRQICRVSEEQSAGDDERLDLSGAADDTACG